MRVPSTTLRRGAVAAAALATLGLAAAPAADAAPSTGITFFKGGKGKARWTPPSEDRAIALEVPDDSSYAGVTLDDAPATLPAAAPSFEVTSTVSGATGGSPRLVVRYDDGTTSSLRPLTLSAGEPTVVSGSDALWEDQSGCGGGYNVTYAAITSCHGSDTVAAVYVVSDSGWLGGYVHTVDDISYGDVLVSEPAGRR